MTRLTLPIEQSHSAPISVVIPTYNSMAHLADVLNSIFAQTLKPAEIIIADDASTDGTPEWVESIAANSPICLRLIQFDQNSGGPARSLNRAIASATSNLIATLDHDDLMRPTKLERQFACWEADPALGLIFCRCTRLDLEGHEGAIVKHAKVVVESMARRELAPRCYRIESDEAIREVLTNCFTITSSTFFFAKSVWSSFGGFDEDLRAACDYKFLGLAAMNFPLGYVDEILIDWRDHGSNLSHSTNSLHQANEGCLIFRDFYHHTSKDNFRSMIRARLHQELFDAAFWARENHAYRDSLFRYLEIIREGGLNSRVLLGMAKLLPHRLRRWVAST